MLKTFTSAAIIILMYNSRNYCHTSFCQQYWFPNFCFSLQHDPLGRPLVQTCPPGRNIGRFRPVWRHHQHRHDSPSRLRLCCHEPTSGCRQSTRQAQELQVTGQTHNGKHSTITSYANYLRSPLWEGGRKCWTKSARPWRQILCDMAIFFIDMCVICVIWNKN